MIEHNVAVRRQPRCRWDASARWNERLDAVSRAPAQADEQARARASRHSRFRGSLTTERLPRRRLVAQSPGMPKPLHLALLVQRFRREVRAPFPPASTVQTAMAPLAALTRVRGHAAR